MMSSPDPLFLNIIVPAFNEEDNIVEALAAIRGVPGLERIPHKLIVVNDNSTDRTRQLVERLRDGSGEMVLVNRRGNHGLGRCLNRAYEEVEGGVIVAVMADLSDDVTDIPVMLDKMREGYDLVSASRYIPGGSGEHLDRCKHALSRLLGRTLQFLIGLPTNDATNAYKMYRFDILDRIGILRSDNYTTGLELTVKAFLAGFRIAEIPTRWRDRSAGTSHFRVVRVAPEYIRWFLWALWKRWRTARPRSQHPSQPSPTGE